eukprot:4264197-Pyramimonas_sp.AAC.1
MAPSGPRSNGKPSSFWGGQVWTCADKKCKFTNNFGWRRTCYVCGVQKPGADARQKSGASDKATAKDDKLEDCQVQALLALDDA